MDTIKPEKDEVDRFRSQRRPPKTASATEKTVTEDKPAAPVQKHDPNTVSLTKSAQFALVFVFLMVVILAGFGYWQVNSQQNTIQTLEQQLDQARQFISQSKLITARLEGQINQTDATMAQSGNEMARELKFLDSEMRKLWDVANKRNKTWIEDNQQAITALQADLKANNDRTQGLAGEVTGLVAMDDSHNQSIAKQEEAIAKLSESSTASINQLKKATEEIQAGQSLLEGQMGQRIQKLEDSVSSQTQSLARVERNVTKLGQNNYDARLKELEENLSGLDKTRNQLVQRFVELDSRISEIALEIRALQSKKAGGAQ
ncbi:hypothetical protein BTA51_09595 [Hahella sp. CCB-MM4]|uniref:hypothetical protein n=1 Tax=Hahella sp. (strain CCB-MM4) TaxID=1926491 RepID=UPI000B9B63BE|nr:hypothetical protein [Hahella sp. CCB-MM4]OZG74019.1 hypothetical protein BTA51_09595 [Hahella sp. CCB-MM4]